MPDFGSLPLWKCLALTLGLALSGSVAAEAHSTGVPLSVSFQPGTVRQGDSASTEVDAIIVLRSASPAFFVCQVRSTDEGKIHFGSVVFAKGQTQAKAVGAVTWINVRKDGGIKVNVFSADAPEMMISGTVNLRVTETDSSESE
jgi:hypothetical protein